MLPAGLVASLPKRVVDPEARAEADSSAALPPRDRGVCLLSRLRESLYGACRYRATRALLRRRTLHLRQPDGALPAYRAGAAHREPRGPISLHPRYASRASPRRAAGQANLLPAAGPGTDRRIPRSGGIAAPGAEPGADA